MDNSLSTDIGHFAIHNAKSAADVCTWSIVECTDGLITTLVASKKYGPSSEIWSVYIEWLPPTVEFVHLQNVLVPKIWARTTLPRALKYLHLKECHGRGIEDRVINFRRFPEKMEELILIRSLKGTVLCFDGLPRTMRLVYILVHVKFVKSIIVNYPDIPATMQEMHVTGFGSKALQGKTRVIGRAHGVKLQTKYDRNYAWYRSKYHRKLEERAQELCDM